MALAVRGSLDGSLIHSKSDLGTRQAIDGRIEALDSFQILI